VRWRLRHLPARFRFALSPWYFSYAAIQSVLIAFRASASDTFPSQVRDARSQFTALLAQRFAQGSGKADEHGDRLLDHWRNLPAFGRIPVLVDSPMQQRHVADTIPTPPTSDAILIEVPQRCGPPTLHRVTDTSHVSAADDPQQPSVPPPTSLSFNHAISVSGLLW
jgi:hypothetical protein